MDMPHLLSILPYLVERVKSKSALARAIPVTTLIYSKEAVRGINGYPLCIMLSNASGYVFKNEEVNEDPSSFPLFWYAQKLRHEGLDRGFGYDLLHTRRVKPSGILGEESLLGKRKKGFNRSETAAIESILAPKFVSAFPLLYTVEADVQKVREGRLKMSDLVGRLSPNDIAALFRRQFEKDGINVAYWSKKLKEAADATRQGEEDHRTRMLAVRMQMEVAGVFLAGTSGIIPGNDSSDIAQGSIRVETVTEDGKDKLRLVDSAGNALEGLEALKYTLKQATATQNKLTGGEVEVSTPLVDIQAVYNKLSFMPKSSGIVLEDDEEGEDGEEDNE